MLISCADSVLHPTGLRMFLFSTMIAQFVFTFKSKFNNGVGLQMVEVRLNYFTNQFKFRFSHASDESCLHLFKFQRTFHFV